MKVPHPFAFLLAKGWEASTPTRQTVHCSLSTVHCKKMGGKGSTFAAARPWVVLKLLQSCVEN
jgi:hypothetical protein